MATAAELTEAGKRVSQPLKSPSLPEAEIEVVADPVDDIEDMPDHDEED